MNTTATPVAEPLNDTLRDWQKQIRECAAHASPLRIAGAGSKHFYGHAVQADAVLETAKHQGVIDYEPTELVVTARCGTPLAEVEALVAKNGQMLAFEAPHFGGGATVGGAVATGLSGPRRMAVGALRDFVLGASLLDGRGDLLHFGGQVMKNVAGYDVSRLMVGALGTLGVVTQASLKVLPVSRTELTLRFNLNAPDALKWLHARLNLPLPISASAWHADALMVRLSGAEAAVSAARKSLGGDEMPEAVAQAHWNALRHQQHNFFAIAANEQLWRLSLPTTTHNLLPEFAQWIEWNGAQRWLRVTADQDVGATAKRIRQVAHQAGGHATLFRASVDWQNRVGVFHPLAPAMATLQNKLRQQFDPARIFNRGCFGSLHSV